MGIEKEFDYQFVNTETGEVVSKGKSIASTVVSEKDNSVKSIFPHSLILPFERLNHKIALEDLDGKAVDIEIDGMTATYTVSVDGFSKNLKLEKA